MQNIYSQNLEYHDPLLLFQQYLENKEYAQILHSSDTEHQLGRYSFICFDPCETIKHIDGNLTIKNNNDDLTFKGNPFAVIKERLEIYCNHEIAESKENLPPFQGGAVGFFGYDLFRLLEEIPEKIPETTGQADMIIGIYDKIISYDHIEKKCWLITRGDTHSKAKNKGIELYNEINNVIVKMSDKNTNIDLNKIKLSWETETPKDEYIKKIEKVIEHIYSGDIFQANLSQKFTASITNNFNHFMHFCYLTEINPAPFSAYLNFEDLKISSASPERFLFVQDKQVETRPIKGTRRKSDDFMIDEEIKEELRLSYKDRAENTMIVDLMRNDLSRTCNDHTVKTTKLCNVETFATVHHLVSTIKGELRGDLCSIDLLETCFPGGSITGAPKIKSIEIIEELETSRRKAYCGSIGYIGFDLTMDTNIAIRTISYYKDTASIRTGGGITAESKPEDEYQETLDKADVLLRSFAPEETLEKTA